MVDEVRLRAGHLPVSHGECDRAIARGVVRRRKRVQRAVKLERRAIQKGCGCALHVLGVGEHEAGGRIIQREAKAHFACRGDGGMAAADFGDAAGEIIGAMVAAKQRHGGGAVLGEGDDRWLAALVLKVGCDGADQDARGAEADDRTALVEELHQVCGRLAVCDVATGDTGGRVDFGAERQLQPLCQRQGGGAEHEEDGLHHASVPA